MENKIIGNTRVMNQIRIALTSAIKRNVALPHMLFSGVAGCGKTTTANHISEALGVKCIQVDSSSLKTYKDVKNVLTQLSLRGYNKKGEVVGRISPDIVFLDEIHQLPLKGQEMFGIAMEKFIWPAPAVAGKMSFVKWLPQFTLVGATTDDGKLSKPFREKFVLTLHFRTYAVHEAVEIIKYHAGKIGMPVEGDAIMEIAKRSRGVPRFMVKFLKNCRDTAVAWGEKKISYDAVMKTFEMQQVNQEGLNHQDIRLLKALFQVAQPVGIDNLSIMLNESRQTIMDSIEPYLIQLGLTVRAPRGRMLTVKGIEYLSKRGYVDEMEAMRQIMERS